MQRGCPAHLLHGELRARGAVLSMAIKHPKKHLPEVSTKICHDTKAVLVGFVRRLAMTEAFLDGIYYLLFINGRALHKWESR